MMSKNKGSGMDTKAKIGTLIGKGAVFNGDFSAPGSVRVDGTIPGNLKCEELLVIGPDGTINGDITTQNVIISGKVEGDIIANGKLELLSTGKLVGNITAKSLVIDENASFDGRCIMTTNAEGASAGSKADSGQENKNSQESAPEDSNYNNNKKR